jgi:hypothetical protein
MEPAGDAVIDVATPRHHWRGALIGAGVALAAGILASLAPQPAHAADDRGLVGSLLGGVTSTVTDIVDPVVDPLPDVRDLPVVGGIVATVVESTPVTTVTQPVTHLVDGLLGDTVGSLPVVGGVLGDTPLGSVVAPVGELADHSVGQLVGTTPGTAVPPLPGSASDAEPIPGIMPTTDAEAASQAAASAALWFSSAAFAAATALLLDSPLADQVVALAVGAGGPFHGPVSVPGELAPSSAVTTGGPPIGLAAAVLGAGLLFMLARGRVRPAVFRVPLSPVFATDSSPD